MSTRVANSQTKIFSFIYFALQPMLITIVMTLLARVSTLDGQIIAFAVFRLMFRRLKDLVHVDRNPR